MLCAQQLRRRAVFLADLNHAALQRGIQATDGKRDVKEGYEKGSLKSEAVESVGCSSVGHRLG